MSHKSKLTFNVAFKVNPVQRLQGALFAPKGQNTDRLFQQTPKRYATFYESARLQSRRLREKNQERTRDFGPPQLRRNEDLPAR